MLHRCLLAIALLCLQACSTVQLGYKQLPTLGHWWLDSRLSFDRTQSAQVRDALGQLQSWHRQHELNVYAQTLQALQKQSLQDVDGPQVCAVWTQFESAMDRLAHQAIVQAAPIAMQLQAAQLRHFVQHQQEQNEAWDKEWLEGSPSERLQRRLDKTAKNYRDFYGSLSATQIALLREQLRSSLWQAEWARRERLRRQQMLIGTLQLIQQNNLSNAQAQEALRKVWQQWFLPPAGPDRQRQEQLVTQACEHLAQIHNSTSPAQRQRAAQRLRNYETDVRELLKP